MVPYLALGHGLLPLAIVCVGASVLNLVEKALSRLWSLSDCWLITRRFTSVLLKLLKRIEIHGRLPKLTWCRHGWCIVNCVVMPLLRDHFDSLLSRVLCGRRIIICAGRGGFECVSIVNLRESWHRWRRGRLMEGILTIWSRIRRILMVLLLRWVEEGLLKGATWLHSAVSLSVVLAWLEDLTCASLICLVMLYVVIMMRSWGSAPIWAKSLVLLLLLHEERVWRGHHGSKIAASDGHYRGWHRVVHHGLLRGAVVVLWLVGWWELHWTDLFFRLIWVQGTLY